MVRQSRKDSEYTGSLGWGQSQPLGPLSVKEYIEAAYERRGLFRDIVENFAKDCGPGIEIVAPRVKSELSANRKVWDRTSSSVGSPPDIGDYLAARVYMPSNPGSVMQLADSMERLMEHPLTVAYKDRIFRPNGSGFRALNARLDVDGMHAELQIVPDDKYGITRMTNNVTEGLRVTERAIRDMEDGLAFNTGRSFNNLVAKSQKTISLIRDFRAALHDYAAGVSGVNALIDPAKLDDHKPPSERELETMFKTLTKDYFGKRSKGKEQMLGLLQLSAHRLNFH